nr:MAG: nonstructural polyprotein [Astroviridae sp.]
MKMKMLTEEEYDRLVQEGFSREEIMEVVDSLRQQAWLDYCIENDIDDEGAEEWYEDMLDADQQNAEIDAQIEKQMEDEGHYFEQALQKLASKCDKKVRKTMADQALLHIVDLRKDRVRTVKIETQQESSDQLVKTFEKMVTKQDVPEGAKVTAVLSNGDDVRVVEQKEINWEKLKMPRLEDEKTFERIERNGTTQISTGDDNKKNIMREKVTTFPNEQVLEQRKRTCKWCGSGKPHNFSRCRSLNEKLFCVWCGKAHSEKEGHDREMKCHKCEQKFTNLDSLEKHVMGPDCSKN